MAREQKRQQQLSQATQKQVVGNNSSIPKPWKEVFQAKVDSWLSSLCFMLFKLFIRKKYIGHVQSFKYMLHKNNFLFLGHAFINIHAFQLFLNRNQQRTISQSIILHFLCFAMLSVQGRTEYRVIVLCVITWYFFMFF